jgi:hypothetical protein
MEMEEGMERAELGIDGDCGFALLGEDLQLGEAVFVKISEAPKSSTNPESWAATQAYRKLQARLPDRTFSHYVTSRTHGNFVL